MNYILLLAVKAEPVSALFEMKTTDQGQSKKAKEKKDIPTESKSEIERSAFQEVQFM